MNGLGEINKLFNDFSEMLISLTKIVYGETYGYLLEQTAQLNSDLIDLVEAASVPTTAPANTNDTPVSTVNDAGSVTKGVADPATTDDTSDGDASISVDVTNNGSVEINDTRLIGQDYLGGDILGGDGIGGDIMGGDFIGGDIKIINIHGNTVTESFNGNALTVDDSIGDGNTIRDLVLSLVSSDSDEGDDEDGNDDESEDAGDQEADDERSGSATDSDSLMDSDIEIREDGETSVTDTRLIGQDYVGGDIIGGDALGGDIWGGDFIGGDIWIINIYENTLTSSFNGNDIVKDNSIGDNNIIDEVDISSNDADALIDFFEDTIHARHQRGGDFFFFQSKIATADATLPFDFDYYMDGRRPTNVMEQENPELWALAIFNGGVDSSAFWYDFLG